MTPRKNRILSYDLLRILAICMVVMIHSTLPFLKECLPPSPDFTWANILNSLSRAGVPLFLMLSGALMLDEKKHNDFHTMLRRTWKLFVPLAAWSFLYSAVFYLLLPFLKHEPYSVKYFLVRFLLGYYHLWFLPLLIGLYLITPILRLFVRKENSRWILYMILLSVLFRFSVPLLNLLSNQITGPENYGETFMNQFRMGFVEPYLIYYILGWFLSTHPLSRRQRKWIYALGAFGLLLTAAGTQLLTSPELKAFDTFYSFESIHVLCYSVAVFVFVFYAVQNHTIHHRWLSRLIVQVSTLSFGIYAVHEMVRPVLGKLFFAEMHGPQIPLLWISVLMVSLGITWAGSRIPILHRLFRI